MSDSIEILLVRHGEIDPRMKKICYGAMDIDLSDQGRLDSQRVAQQILTSVAPQAIFHSGLSRTRYMADQIARLGPDPLPVIDDMRLRERNYGRWQGLSWDDAYASDPENFDGLIERPDSYRPPGGETTTEMQDRMVDWLDDLVTRSSGDQPGPIIAVSHSGPIAAMAGKLLNLPPTQWGPWMVAPLATIHLVGRRHLSTVSWEVRKR
ncbi:histidine phosphatase family protein [Stieleria sp. TO1_6]|uniref:histidine phosphatase family protein n=1 Tax=Stieleria tagensis TaxID=2956795 RepID=UPI0021BC94A3|nr:histidine phosphatase family protein [Stieleria tagensis]MCO8121066.1 histidine phosphatase family protein [Stieleria tagensis]